MVLGNVESIFQIKTNSPESRSDSKRLILFLKAKLERVLNDFLDLFLKQVVYCFYVYSSCIMCNSIQLAVLKGRGLLTKLCLGLLRK